MSMHVQDAINKSEHKIAYRPYTKNYRRMGGRILVNNWMEAIITYPDGGVEKPLPEDWRGRDDFEPV